MIEGWYPSLLRTGDKAGRRLDNGHVHYAGEQCQACLSYQESGLKHLDDTMPMGTQFEIETLREYRLNVSSLDDAVGQRKFNAHRAPLARYEVQGWEDDSRS